MSKIFSESNSVSESDNIKATEVKNNNSSESKEIVYSDDYLYKKYHTLYMLIYNDVFISFLQ